MNRPKLSLEKHREAGRELKRHRDYLVKLCADQGLRDGSRRHVLKAAHRALRAVDDLRASLDGLLALDWTMEFDTRIYYPGHPVETSEVRGEHPGEIGLR